MWHLNKIAISTGNPSVKVVGYAKTDEYGEAAWDWI